jgi:hypothetical protein
LLPSYGDPGNENELPRALALSARRTHDII